MLNSEDKNEHTLHNLNDFAFAREVVRDHPRILTIYKKLLPVLYRFAQYQAVWPVIQLVEESILLLDMQLSYYQKIYDSKGIVKDDDESTRKKEKRR